MRLTGARRTCDGFSFLYNRIENIDRKSIVYFEEAIFFRLREANIKKVTDKIYTVDWIMRGRYGLRKKQLRMTYRFAYILVVMI